MEVSFSVPSDGGDRMPVQGSPSSGRAAVCASSDQASQGVIDFQSELAARLAVAAGRLHACGLPASLDVPPLAEEVEPRGRNSTAQGDLLPSVAGCLLPWQSCAMPGIDTTGLTATEAPRSDPAPAQIHVIGAGPSADAGPDSPPSALPARIGQRDGADRPAGGTDHQRLESEETEGKEKPADGLRSLELAGTRTTRGPAAEVTIGPGAAKTPVPRRPGEEPPTVGPAGDVAPEDAARGEKIPMSARGDTPCEARGEQDRVPHMERGQEPDIPRWENTPRSEEAPVAPEPQAPLVLGPASAGAAGVEVLRQGDVTPAVRFGGHGFSSPQPYMAAAPAVAVAAVRGSERVIQEPPRTTPGIGTPESAEASVDRTEPEAAVEVADGPRGAAELKRAETLILEITPDAGDHVLRIPPTFEGAGSSGTWTAETPVTSPDAGTSGRTHAPSGGSGWDKPSTTERAEPRAGTSSAARAGSPGDRGAQVKRIEENLGPAASRGSSVQTPPDVRAARVVRIPEDAAPAHTVTSGPQAKESQREAEAAQEVSMAPADLQGESGSEAPDQLKAGVGRDVATSENPKPAHAARPVPREAEPAAKGEEPDGATGRVAVGEAGPAPVGRRSETGAAEAPFGARGRQEGPLHTFARDVARTVADQIVQRAELRLATSEAKMIIDLKPDALGKVHLKVTADGGRIRAEIRVETGVTGSIMEASLPDLKAALGERGLVLETVAVSADVGCGVAGGGAGPGWSARDTDTDGNRATRPAEETRRARVVGLAGASRFYGGRMHVVDCMA